MEGVRYLNYNAYGNLEGGIIKGRTIEDVKKYLVEDFPNSLTRKRNFEGLTNLLEKFDEINLNQFIDKFWIDGSFTTLKPDPNDIDLVFFLSGEENKIRITNEIVNDSKQLKEFSEQFYCDTYFILDKDTISDEHPEAKRHFDMLKKYWMGQFGYDRNENPKGIIEIDMPINKEE